MRGMIIGTIFVDINIDKSTIFFIIIAFITVRNPIMRISLELRILNVCNRCIKFRYIRAVRVKRI